jgi:alanine racemase
MKSGPLAKIETWVEIDLDRLRKNYQSLRKNIRPKTKIMAVVKADAYGHGLIPVARALVRLGSQALGVGTVAEGILVRKKVDPQIPVILLLGLLPGEIEPCIHYRLTPVLYSMETALQLHQAAKRRKIRVTIHLKVDTGMGRLGVPWSELEGFLKKINRLEGLHLTGLTSHFGQADEKDQAYNQQQWTRYLQALKLTRQYALDLTDNHMANSAALLNYRPSHLHYVRPGILLYGCNPTEFSGKKPAIKINPVMSLKSRILQVKRIPAGIEVSYGGTYRTRHAETVAIIPAGYANGYPRSLSNQTEVLIRGRRFPVIGRVCMNLIVIRVEEALDLQVGEEVVLMGSQGKATITPEELARKAGTIPYELFCLMGRLNPRKYLGH